MKFGRYLIVSLPDFRRHFSWNEFYRNRSRFAEDMHPGKVFYWSPALVEAYHSICEWIDSPARQPSEVLPALNILLGTNAKIEASAPECNYDFNNPVILINRNSDISLPKSDDNDTEETFTIKLHKLVASRDSDRASVVTIGGDTVAELAPGEIAYATEINGKFIELLPSCLENEFSSAILIDCPGSFTSMLIITDKRSGIKQTVDNVVSFALVDRGYIYITEIGDLVSIDNATPMFCIRDNDLKPVQVANRSGIVTIQYDNGICKSTNSLTPIKLKRLG